MYKLFATIRKDIQILIQDKVGLTFMFSMPIVLVVVMTAIQNSTFDLVNKNKLPLLISNQDTGRLSGELVQAIGQVGMFKMLPVEKDLDPKMIADSMHAKEAMLAVVIPPGFSTGLESRAKTTASKALNSFGLQGDMLHRSSDNSDPLTLYYHPILQESFRLTIRGALNSGVQMVQSKEVLRILYQSINGKELPDSLEKDMLHGHLAIDEIPLSMNGSRNSLNAAQHNVPAWTLFAMFFIVISLGGSIVREKRSGSFIRLKTLPTPYVLALFSKQLTYLGVTLIQAALIFSIGVWVFPFLSLPTLNMPHDIFGLFLVSLICGWCAVSYAICVGVFARTQEQANGFGAVSIVILAAIGGLMVPDFAMPASFAALTRISPLHWCLHAYYGLFLEGGKLGDILKDIIPLLAITVLIQLITVWGLKRKRLI